MEAIRGNEENRERGEKGRRRKNGEIAGLGKGGVEAKERFLFAARGPPCQAALERLK